ncbi:MAG: nucleotide exchange factor GrpE [Saprospiraceae bacterium]|jgi:molecular chaperone GrpE|nr:nucleotide exchange factor GrpE [Saprospiraceae bacterium]MBK7796304.1 nucleotide exchange factor GrpE [Saprospiraceae bacterium]MBK9378325.1 nucleotide exchange factor GrpE [Saprospiraceae bacterium]MBL0260304.1 nucleotide exchange factor GrpE [Saprospiraceae bacterium]
MMNEEKDKIENEILENTEDQTLGSEEADANSMGTKDQNLALQLADQKDKYLRLFAEFDNFRKRSYKEKNDYIKNASQDLVADLLVILDDFERAQKLAEDQKNTEIFPEGMRLIYHKLLLLLKQRGLEAMDSTNVVFDPSLHEAVTEFPAPSEEMKGKVFDTLEKGYLLNDKIIRYAKVVVAK